MEQIRYIHRHLFMYVTWAGLELNAFQETTYIDPSMALAMSHLEPTQQLVSDDVMSKTRKWPKRQRRRV